MKLRVAIVGGDGRVEQLRWGRQFDLTFFQAERYAGAGELKRLQNAMAANKFDVIVVMARWIGHSFFGAVRSGAQCRVVTWDRGQGDLVKCLPGLVEGRQVA